MPLDPIWVVGWLALVLSFNALAPGFGRGDFVQPFDRTEMSRTILSEELLSRALAVPDLTDPRSGPHALQCLVTAAVEALCAAWQCEPVIERQSPSVSTADNHDRLHYPPDGAARALRDTRYASEERVLRTQTSAMDSFAPAAPVWQRAERCAARVSGPRVSPRCVRPLAVPSRISWIYGACHRMRHRSAAWSCRP